jgi:hypothetical protein
MARIAFLGSHPGTSPVAGQPLEHVPQVKQTSASSGEVAIFRSFLFILMGSSKMFSLPSCCGVYKFSCWVVIPIFALRIVENMTLFQHSFV